jgi:SAM-dependent methyltransferase
LRKDWVFDSEWAQDYIRARQMVISTLLSQVKRPLELTTALDVGCGVGHFSKFLFDTGLRVVAVDGREANASEGRERYPEITFLTRNAEDPALPNVGTFDFVLCVGLIYHLENPFRTVRSLHEMTKKLLVVEAMCAAGTEPTLHLVDEDPGDDQGLNYVAFYPTESCLVKMLYRAGFPYVYGFQALPNHSLFHATFRKRQERTMLVASKCPLPDAQVKLLPNTRGSWEILWAPRERLWRGFGRMARLFRVSRST